MKNYAYILKYLGFTKVIVVFPELICYNIFEAHIDKM
jgi:hypothetical protein